MQAQYSVATRVATRGSVRMRCPTVAFGFDRIRGHAAFSASGNESNEPNPWMGPGVESGSSPGAGRQTPLVGVADIHQHPRSRGTRQVHLYFFAQGIRLRFYI